jgi:hypothetical protein
MTYDTYLTDLTFRVLASEVLVNSGVLLFLNTVKKLPFNLFLIRVLGGIKLWGVELRVAGKAVIDGRAFLPGLL